MGKGLVAELRKGEKGEKKFPNNYISVSAISHQLCGEIR